MWCIKNRNLFVMALEPEKSKIQAPANSMSDEALLPGHSVLILQKG